MLRPDDIEGWISDRAREAGELTAYVCGNVPGKGRIISQLDLSSDPGSIKEALFSAVINNCEGMGKKSFKIECFYRGEPNPFQSASVRIQDVFDEYDVSAPILSPNSNGGGSAEIKSAAYLLTKSIEILHKTTVDANKRATDAQKQSVDMMREIASLQASLARQENGSEVIQAIQALAPIASLAAAKMLGAGNTKQIAQQEEQQQPDPEETAKEIMEMLDAAPEVRARLFDMLGGGNNDEE